MIATAATKPCPSHTAADPAPLSRPDVPGIDRATETSIDLLIARRARMGQVAESDREDLAQHLRLALLEAIPNFRPAQSAWPTFVRAVLHSSMQGWLRRRLRPGRNERLNQSIFSSADQELTHWAAELPDTRQSDVCSRAERGEALQAVLAHLGGDDRRIAELLMHHQATQVMRLISLDSKGMYAAIRRVRLACIAAGVVS